MKRSLTLIAVLFWSMNLYAQFEVSVQANSGLFHFTGLSATANTAINSGYGAQGPYANTPYGSNNAFSYEIGAKAQYVTTFGLLLGLQGGFQVLRSSEAITQAYNNSVVFYMLGTINSGYAYTSATGTAYLRSEYIDANPYLGYRFNLKKIRIDLLAGPDIGYLTDVHSYGNALGANGESYSFTNKLTSADVPKDWRVKIATTIWYKRWGINAGQFIGLTDHTKYLVGGQHNAQSRLTLFGISYRIF